MLVEKLSMEKRKEFLKTLHTILMFDRMILWEDKTEDEIDTDTDMTDVSFSEDIVKDNVYNRFNHLCRYRVSIYDNEPAIRHLSLSLTGFDNKELNEELINDICKLPIFKQNKKFSRIDIARRFISEYEDEDRFFRLGIAGILFTDQNNASLDGPETYKIFLSHLIKACVEAECLTQERVDILKYFCEIKSIDLVYFDEILEHVMLAQKAKQKLIDIVLE